MKYRIKPEKYELEKARKRIETAVQKFEHQIDLEEIDFYINWQNLEKPVSTSLSNNSLVVTIDPEKNWEDKLDQSVLRGVLHLEFLDKGDGGEESFHWQEVLRWAYVMKKSEKILSEEDENKGEINEWRQIREKLSEEIMSNEFDPSLYDKMPLLGERIGEKLLEEHEINDFPDLKRTDVLKAGDRIF